MELKRHLLCGARHALVCLAVIACSYGSAVGQDVTREFALTSLPLASEAYLGRYINSDRPGQLYFLAYGYSYTYASQFGTDIIGYQIDAYNRLSPLETDLARDRLDEIICITAAPGYLCVANARSGKRRDVYYSTMGERGGGSVCLFFARDEYTRKELLSEPTERLPMHYDEEHGLSVFNYYSSGRVVVRRHKRDLYGPGYVLAGVKAHGRGFLDGRITHVFVCDDGTVQRFSPESLKLEPAADLDWQAALLRVEAIAGGTGDPREFVFTHDLLACEEDDSGMLLLDRAGVTHRIGRRDVLTRALDGSQRSEQDQASIESDKLHLRAEGRQAGTGFVSNEIQLIAVDDSRVAIFDVPYQRVVFVSARQ